MSEYMTPMQRTLKTMEFCEPDRVPLFLLLTMHGAKELGLSIKNYFSEPEYVAEGQVRLQKKFGSDCYFGFTYAALEAEAWGSDVIFIDNGPPNAGRPVIREPEDIEKIQVPEISECPCLQNTLSIVERLNKAADGNIPVISAAVSPFSLPVMQMGFEGYLDLIYSGSPLFDKLMKKNEQFCISWANALFDAGATAVAYFDPLASPDIIDSELFRRTGLLTAKRVISKVKGPMAMHLASGRALPAIGDISETGCTGVAVSAFDDLAAVKEACYGKITVMGNLNGVEMRRWTDDVAEAKVKEAISAAGHGGGFILTDNHGEIPYQVPDSVLYAIGKAVRKWGQYPLD
ncbi:uroporphyrinogen decarboxylase family protein [Methanoplanus endosymbiosus]|uniref:Uroporphyrinogen decarboxylase family protein n=1 Tax=Methanoplanus endosymbiosus TaxID=33865 RepID=A0A9E7PP71_9EURY|nr:uroporphyrinogen decarboxylase family protein [Methanoplanus endosymbiosus]UUX92501.1 uroporphyrinogen decarboxylase family protein [Methanoplanus endosymbiosus]